MFGKTKQNNKGFTVSKKFVHVFELSVEGVVYSVIVMSWEDLVMEYITYEGSHFLLFL